MVEATDAGDVGEGLRAAADALSDVARHLLSEAAAWLPPQSASGGVLRGIGAALNGISAEMRSTLAPAVSAEMAAAEITEA
ncbi:hypothetical protein [Plantactinospora sp. CA-290183]|uniref:hypothetical protein n=1 Tax=Plantactinospora sp. CA-290183 TaxID=3240006 RepID=UPI003D8E6599